MIYDFFGVFVLMDFIYGTGVLGKGLLHQSLKKLIL